LFFPNSLFKYFSGAKLSEERKIKKEQPTRSFLFYLLCHDREDGKYFGHDFDDNVSHCRGGCHCRVRLEASEKNFDPFEQVNERILARFDILCRLTSLSQWHLLEDSYAHQEKDTNTGKDHVCGREYLIKDDQSTDSREITIRVSPGQYPPRDWRRTRKGRSRLD
jgi:hypothetical protein